MPFGIQNRFGLRRPDPEDLFEGQNPEMIPPWEREAMPEIRSIPPEIAESPDPSLIDNLMRGFTAQDPVSSPYGGAGDTPVFDRYLEEIQNAPRREDYQLSTGKKILAGLAGAATGFTSGASAGSRAIQDITEGPYRNAQRDFKERIEPLEKGIGYEKSFAETLRKKQNDQNKFGSNLATIEANRDKALAQIKIMKQRANTDEARQEADEAHKSVMAEYYRAKADNDRGSVRARQTSADASMIRANKPPGTGSAPRGRFVSPTQQTNAVKLAKQKTFEETARIHPNIAVTQDPKTFELVFGKDVTPEDEEKFYENYNLNKSLVEQGILNKRQQ